MYAKIKAKQPTNKSMAVWRNSNSLGCHCSCWTESWIAHSKGNTLSGIFKEIYLLKGKEIFMLEIIERIS